ncbi:hypothetical protein MLD38_025669 [Melastoma candidum]|uniref:Uncharacterized protein n=1 Tax=Melastoma candidum TaxID=119954 RepID=A0ACB9NVT6_9MYRT|nr:hypothetical protein MLD38_025669 [Melastoma candidum]
MLEDSSARRPLRLDRYVTDSCDSTQDSASRARSKCPGSTSGVPLWVQEQVERKPTLTRDGGGTRQTPAATTLLSISHVGLDVTIGLGQVVPQMSYKSDKSSKGQQMILKQQS